MGFEVVHGNPQTIWAPVVNSDTLYVGQLVRCNNEGVEPFVQASGLADQARKMASVALIADGGSANNQLFGVVIGTNKRTPTFNTTYKAEYITYVSPASASSGDYFGVEGVWAKGDLQAMVKVALITSETVLRGPIYNAAYGTAPTVLTVASGASTTGCTTNASESTNVASEATIYFRTGAAAGCYRICDGTSATAQTWDIPTGTTCAVGDTAVKVQLRTLGQSKIMLDSEATYIDNNAELTSHYHLIDVIRLDLSEAGKEYVEFRMSTYTMLSYDDIA